MSDGGKIRPDDDKQFQKNGGQSSLEQQRATREEAEKSGGFDDIDITDDVSENDFDAHQYFLERSGNIDFTDMEENQFMKDYANTIISSFPHISHDDASALLLYVTRSEASRQGVLDNIVVRIDDEIKVGVTRFARIGEKGVISEIVFSEKELIDGVNNGNMTAYVTGIGHLVEAASHEVEHAKQNSKMYSKNPELDYATLRMAKESIIIRVNPEFYRNNYRSYTMEQNAFLNGRMQEKKALENLRKVFPEDVFAKIEKRIDELIEFDKSADTTKMKTEESGYTDIDNAEMVLTELTDSIMPMYVTDALEKYPILSYQYREDGTKKDLLQLFQERDSRIKQLEEQLLSATPSRKIEIEKEIDGIRNFYSQMIQGDRQLIAQKEEFDKQQTKSKESKEQKQIEMKQQENDKGTHDNNIYQYTDAVQSIQSDAFCEYCDYIVVNNIEMTEEGQKEFIGKAMGKKYAELFEGADEKALAEIFGRLDYSSLYDTQMNYDEWTNTKVISLLGLQKVQGVDGSEIFVAQYEQSMEDGEPYEMVSEYYSLDEKGNLVQQEAPQIQESAKSVVITQRSIADKLGQKSQERVANSEQIQIPSTKTREDKILDRVGKGLDNVINSMDNIETKMTDGLDKLVGKVEKVAKPIFDQALLLAGFRPDTIAGLKSSIQMVSPRALLTMDNILGRTKEQTLSRGGIEDGNEQDYR